MNPRIEYHFEIEDLTGARTVHSELAPVGTTFDQIREHGWSWAEQFIPLRLEWPAYAWPGGYEIHYITHDCGVLCHQCANEHLDLTLDDDPQWQIIAADINYENNYLYCDHCNRDIEPAYDVTDDEE